MYENNEQIWQIDTRMLNGIVKWNSKNIRTDIVVDSRGRALKFYRSELYGGRTSI